MNRKIFNYFASRFPEYRVARRSDQKALEDIIQIVNRDEESWESYEQDLMNGFLIISEHGQKWNFDIYKLSDFGIEYITFRISL